MVPGEELPLDESVRWTDPAAWPAAPHWTQHIIQNRTHANTESGYIQDRHDVKQTSDKKNAVGKVLNIKI